jgi:L-ascorbate metabolism protein UlaG (beta-lactamase superfamily)
MSVRITWWGHATAAIEIGGRRLLTDPLLTDRLAHLRRIGSPAPGPQAADAVLISHLHMDHLHLPSLRRVEADTLVVPTGAQELVRSDGRWRGGRIEAMAPHGLMQVGEVAVRAVPARHDGRRWRGSPVCGPALGYLIEHAGVRIWFAGDTGLFDAMNAFGPVDVAVVPVGGWGPTLGPEHLDPGQAARACAAVRARHAVPVHYGTFWPMGLRRLHPNGFRDRFERPAQHFADAVAGQYLPTRVHAVRPGETVILDD